MYDIFHMSFLQNLRKFSSLFILIFYVYFKLLLAQQIVRFRAFYYIDDGRPCKDRQL